MTVVEHMNAIIMEVMILSLLKEQEMSVAQLCLELNKLPKEVVQIFKRGIVCSLLCAMTKKGVTAEREEKVDRKTSCVYFHLTDAGRDYFDCMIKEAWPLCGYIAGIIMREKVKDKTKE